MGVFDKNLNIPLKFIFKPTHQQLTIQSTLKILLLKTPHIPVQAASFFSLVSLWYVDISHDTDKLCQDYARCRLPTDCSIWVECCKSIIPIQKEVNMLLLALCCACFKNYISFTYIISLKPSYVFTTLNISILGNWNDKKLTNCPQSHTVSGRI